MAYISKIDYMMGFYTFQDEFEAFKHVFGPFKTHFSMFWGFPGRLRPSALTGQKNGKFSKFRKKSKILNFFKF